MNKVEFQFVFKAN